MEVVFQGRIKKGKEIFVRYPEAGDVEEMRQYINELSKEKTFIRYQGEQETLKSERKWLEERLKQIKNKKVVHLLAFYNDKLVGATEIHMMDKTEKHIGILGISISKNFRGNGLGKLLMELILKEAKREIPALKIVTLQVYSTNNIAKNLYEKIGFVDYGLLPNGIIRGEKLEDAVLMYKNT